MPGIWDHKPWDRDQWCCVGIRDQVFRQKIKCHKMAKFRLIEQKELPQFTNSNVVLHFVPVLNCYAIRSAGLA